MRGTVPSTAPDGSFMRAMLPSSLTIIRAIAVWIDWILENNGFIFEAIIMSIIIIYVGRKI